MWGRAPREPAQHPQHSLAQNSFLTICMSFHVIEEICRGCCRPHPAPSAKENQLWGQDVALSPFQPTLQPQRCPWGAPRSPPAPQPLSGYTWCFNKCFLLDFLIFVFSEKALASSNSFLRVAARK